MLAPWKKSYDQPRQFIKKQRHYFVSKGPSSQSYGFSSSHVWVWELKYKENWALKNWCFWTVVLEKTLESPLGCKEIQPVHPKDQSWVFIWRTDAKAETPVLWPPDAKSWLIGKDPDLGKDWRQEKGIPEDEMVEWHHWHCQWTWLWVNSGSWWCYLTISFFVAPSSAFNLSQHQGLFQLVSSSHQVAKILELQLPHQSLKWILRVNFL